MWLNRQQLLIGADACERLRHSQVCICGLGGVGSAAAEAVCRAGVGTLILVDHDCVDLTNLNRQIVATRDCIGQKKVAAMARRLQQINPDCQIIPLDCFVADDTLPLLGAQQPSYIIDAIDTVTSKLALAQYCRQQQIGLICCLGTGNRLDPTGFHIGDIADTAGCGDPLARVMRRECRKRGIENLTVVYSTAPVLSPAGGFAADSPRGRHAPGSVSFVPPVAGYTLAAHVITQLAGL